ncbi:MAG: hypothetical protein COA82_00545 [Alkaliphilus sp.]|nr:PilN domain-containing protein [Alkaliphilus sp. AH-315-G20]PHS36496.1 MAG: hypothetical protein COA82_00545 [Alkaliphilus sp.]
MREINFFEHLKPNKNKGNLLILISISLVCFFLVGYAIFNTIKIMAIEKEVAVLSQATSSVEVMQKLSTIEQMREEMIDLEGIYNIFLKNYESINEKSSISYTLFNSIVSASPNDLFFKSLRMEKQTVSIEIFAHTQNSLTEFEKNISRKSNMKVDSISNLVMKPGHYSFTIVISIEE